MIILEYEKFVRDFYFQCEAGVGVASIAANGDILACLDIERRKDLVQGNIYKNDFIDIWEKGFKIFRQDWSEKSLLCKKCKHIWRKVGIFDGDFGHFCPKCGTPKPVCYYESSEGTLDASFLFINEPTLYKKIKYRIKKIKQKISNIFKKEKYNVRK